MNLENDEMTDDPTPEPTDADLHLLKLDLAVAHGRTGERAADFASRLRGETAEDLATDAQLLADALTPIVPPSPKATDPSQGRSMPDTPADPALEEFKDIMRRSTRIYVP